MAAILASIERKDETTTMLQSGLNYLNKCMRFVLRNATIPMLAGLGSSSVFADKPPEPLTVATWNLEWFFDDVKANNRSDVAKEQSAPSREEWDWKLYTVAAAIAKFKPTILAVQEIEDRNVMQALTKALKEKHDLNYRVAFIDGFDSGTEQDVAIIFQSGLVEFSRREQTNEMFRSNEFYNLSKHMFARFEWQVGDRTEFLTILNMHLRATADAADLRKRQCRLAHAWVRARVEAGENVIVLGDLNVEEAAGAVQPDGDGMHLLLGRHTPSENDDLIDLLEKSESPKQATHLILDKQFDRMLVSPKMLSSSPAGIQFQAIEVLSRINVRGNGPDLDHWDTRFTKDRAERDISDHHPVMATFVIR
jgi:endonuclease/exonuclease/phosphatase family metal-dependent hydrolase